MKKTTIVFLALLLALSLCACVSRMPEQDETIPKLGEDDPAAAVLYTVTVTDESSTPVPGAMVQLCSDICVPGVTDEEGIARFTLTPGDYKVSMTVMPQGYAHAGDATEFTFPEGSRELTIVLKAE